VLSSDDKIFDNLGKLEKTKEPISAGWRRRVIPCMAVSSRSSKCEKNNKIIVVGSVKDFIMWSSYKERVEDALALRGDEGRDRLR
jgi:hypothetical protein